MTPDTDTLLLRAELRGFYDDYAAALDEREVARIDAADAFAERHRPVDTRRIGRVIPGPVDRLHGWRGSVDREVAHRAVDT